ncbi:MAG: MMPL family transporter [Actinobacteria bacterium]|nr:MMPL family transporter [Actinomycetota bacterium]
MGTLRRAGLAAAFVAAILGLTVVSFLVPDNLKIAGFGTPGSQSQRATAAIHRAFGYDPEPGMAVLARGHGPIGGARGRAEVRSLAREIASDPAVARVQTPFDSQGSGVLLSRDGLSALVLVHFRGIGEEGASAAIGRIRKHVRSPSLSVRYGGFDVGFVDDNDVVRKDLLRAELIAFPILALVLITVFRGMAAALLPLVIGGLSVLGTFAALKLLSHAIDISVYALNLSSAMGLGLAVDSGLFLVTRYREESAQHGVTPLALRRTMSRSGTAVFYSAATVAGACAALLVFPQQFIYSMGIGGVLTAFLSATAALIVVPPLLPKVAHRTHGRIGRRELPESPGVEAHAGWWYRFSRWVMRHAVLVAVVSAVLIVSAGIPATGVRWTFLDAKALPPGLESRTVADAIAREFVPNLEFPISIALSPRLAGDPGRVRALQSRIAGLPSAGIVSQPQRAPDGTGLLQVVSRAPPLSGASQALVGELRSLGEPIAAGGRIADFVDLKASIRSHALPALIVVTLTTLLALFLLTSSVVLPLKALLMNSLTLAAVFGAMVAIFQDRLFGIASLVGYHGPPAIETAISVVVIGVTLGLATDYSILLLSRVKEEHDKGRPNEDAVALGLERSGRVITNAALFQAVALLAMASSRVFVVKQLAVGIAVGVAIDATIVRACLVPALMRILGQVNWWAPRWLNRAHLRVDASVRALIARLSSRSPGDAEVGAAPATGSPTASG